MRRFLAHEQPLVILPVGDHDLHFLAELLDEIRPEHADVLFRAGFGDID